MFYYTAAPSHTPHLPDGTGSMLGIVQNLCISRVSKMSSNYNVAQFKGHMRLLGQGRNHYKPISFGVGKIRSNDYFA